jgi:sugar/nucleoside kinase (ribokinase family)
LPTFDVSVIGELNLDLILYGLPSALQLDREHLADALSITLGSSSAIFAHNLSLLGTNVGFSSCIGSDALGEMCIQRLTDSGVDFSRVRRFKEKITGLTVVVPQGRQRFILTYPGAMSDLTLRDLDMKYVFDAKHLHVSSYFLQKGLRPSFVEILRRAKGAGLTTSLDTNDDPDDRWSKEIQRLWPYVDILLPNEKEACRLADIDDPDKAIDLLAKKVPILAVKRGSQGAVVCSSEVRRAVGPLAVNVVDSVGAGDSFNAGFIHQFIRGARVEDCLTYANATAALSTTRAGGTEAFRDREHREKFLKENARQVSSPHAPSPSTAR